MSVKNDDALVKLASVVQRLISANNRTSDDGSEFGLSDEERDRLLREAEKEIQALKDNQEP